MSKQMLDEYFQSLNVSITLWPETKTISFKTIEKFVEFITNEREFWRSIQYTASINEISNRFQLILDCINNSLQMDNSSTDQAKIKIQQAINNASNKSWPTVYSKTKIAQFIKSQCMINANVGEAATQYLIQRQLGNLGTYDYFKGYLNSYLFEESDKAFKEAAAAQGTNLSNIHQEYLDQLINLDGEYDRITKSWKNEYDSKVSLWNKETDDFKNNVTKWRENFEQDANVKRDRIYIELESIQKRYTEHLRLEGPAKYWKELENDYKEAGDSWRMWSIGTTVVFVLLLTIILLIHPDSNFIKDGALDVNSLRNALIFTIITSVCIYMITLFVKLAISSYHLSRDAKERYQLTHVYLSLLNENNQAINDAERITVLQSLFSRADTGLLKGDAGPSIPDSLSQIIKLLKR